MTERCGHWMPRAQEPCALPVGHKAHHRGAAKAAYEKAYYQAHREQAISREKVRYQANREQKLAYHKAYHEAHREEKLAYRRAYNASDKGKENARKRIESGRNAARQAVSRRRLADERCDNLDPRLETLLGGLIGSSTT